MSESEIYATEQDMYAARLAEVRRILATPLVNTAADRPVTSVPQPRRSVR